VTPYYTNTLAQLSLSAYSDTPTALPYNFVALDPSNFNLPLAPGETFSNGVFRSGNGAALLTSAFIDGTPSIIVAFRGSDETLDSQQDLNDINQAYSSFASLISAVEATAAAWGHSVVLTGHSLGGSLAQMYMQNHPDTPGGPAHTAVTFGSGGAILLPFADPRITNYVIADDPAVVLGAHRTEIGETLRENPPLAEAVATQIAQELPGLTREQALDSLPNLTVDYDNHGNIVLLPDQSGRLDSESALANLGKLDSDRHAVELYVSQLATSLETGQTLTIPELGSADPELQRLQAIYDGSYPNTAQSQEALDLIVRSWANNLTGGLVNDANDVFTDVRDGLANISSDLNLL